MSGVDPRGRRAETMQLGVNQFESRSMTPKSTKFDPLTPPPDIAKSYLGKLKRCQSIAREENKNMPVAWVEMLLMVAMEPGISVTDIATAMGTYQGHVSRTLLELGPRARDGGPGLELIEARPHPIDMRVKQYVLTPRGRALCNRLLRELGSPEVFE